MISTPPRPDESDEPLEVGWAVEGSAGRSGIEADEVDRASRTYWEAEADAYQAEHGAFLSGDAIAVVDSVDSIDRVDYHNGGGGPGAFVWGPEGLTEFEAGLLGPVEDLEGARVLEVGCGAAQCSRWLADRGVRAVGIDISIAQLRHALPHLAPPHPSAPPRPTGSRRVSADRVRSDPTGSLAGPSYPDAIVNGRSGGGGRGSRNEGQARCPGGNGHCASVHRRVLRCGVRLVWGDPVRGRPPPAAWRGPARPAAGWAVGVLRDPPDPLGVP